MFQMIVLDTIRSSWQPVVAAEESQESSNTSMRLVTADAACQQVSVLNAAL